MKTNTAAGIGVVLYAIVVSTGVLVFWGTIFYVAVHFLSRVW